MEAGGRTITVIGTPLDRTYPSENSDLQRRIMTEHLVISQLGQVSPTIPSFPMRNRTMALLTDATVIVEAGEKSGTLHLGWEALRLGRLLFLLDSVVRNESLSWPKEMIRYGAGTLAREFPSVDREYPIDDRGAFECIRGLIADRATPVARRGSLTLRGVVTDEQVRLLMSLLSHGIA